MTEQQEALLTLMERADGPVLRPPVLKYAGDSHRLHTEWPRLAMAYFTRVILERLAQRGLA